jgi:xanthine dehydrogenase YagR molybdenum-binding subunit
MVADWRDDGLTIYASTQFTASVRDEAADLFELPKHRVRVISDFTGGGFGAKYGIGNFGLLAINLSRKAGAPVRMVLDRREEHVSSGNRPSSIQRLKVGARRDGTLTAIQLVSYGSGGVAGGGGVGFAHAMMYACPNVSEEQYDVFTNTGPCAAFRAPGQVQGIFALEQTIDELADRLEIDPLALRDSIDTGGTDDARARKVERQVGAEKFEWSRRRMPNADAGPVKRGVGMAQSQWVSVIHPPTACEVRITDDGSVEAFTSAQDVGTGTRTVLAQVVAEELGLRAHRRHAVPGGAAVRRQPCHGIVDARCAQRRLPGGARARKPSGIGARRERGRHRIPGWPCRRAQLSGHVDAVQGRREEGRS